MKRIWAVTLALLALFCLPAGSSRAENARVDGDLDGSGTVTAADAAMVLRGALGLTTLDNSASGIADVTGSMSVNEADATAILMLCTGGIDDFMQIEAAPADSLMGERHLDQFSYRGTVDSGVEYRSDRISIRMHYWQCEAAVIYVADVYLHDIDSFQTVFAGGGYMKSRALPLDLAADTSALIALSGDFYIRTDKGPLVRNGDWYRETVDPDLDVCVLYRNGVMETYDAGTVDVETIRNGDPWQSWVYGPRLLDDDGHAMETFHCKTEILKRASRAALGYYEPGHYCFVLVDGRQTAGAIGMTMPELSKLMESLGCVRAYNLCGGQSAAMATAEEAVGRAERDGRSISDMMFIMEAVRTGGTR